MLFSMYAKAGQDIVKQTLKYTGVELGINKFGFWKTIWQQVTIF